ncbi:hypothetical protein HCH52_08780 [Oscillospiraceae bacterium HV4-5-C5C]|nr:hypothetical protein [Oscillospiraceae bacterium HV4-5-C5C]
MKKASDMENLPSRRRLLLACCANLLLLSGEVIGVTLSWQRSGWQMLTFYTEDSNILSLLAALLMSVFLIRQLRTGRPLPACAVQLKFMSTCGLTLTFLVVVTILAPAMGGGLSGYRLMLLEGSMLFNHLLSPLLTLLTFLLLDPGSLPSVWSVPLAIIPTLIYAAITLTLNITRQLDGPYPFLRVYQQAWWMSALWCLLILGGAAVIAVFLRIFRNHRVRS